MVKLVAEAVAAARIRRMEKRYSRGRRRRSIIGQSLEKRLAVPSCIVGGWAEGPGPAVHPCVRSPGSNGDGGLNTAGVPRRSRCPEKGREFKWPDGRNLNPERKKRWEAPRSISHRSRTTRSARTYDPPLGSMPQPLSRWK